MDTTAPESLSIGNATLVFHPHYIAGVGARVFVIVDTTRRASLSHEALNMGADDARRFADRLKIAACQADGLAKKACRRKQNEEHAR